MKNNQAPLLQNPRSDEKITQLDMMADVIGDSRKSPAWAVLRLRQSQSASLRMTAMSCGCDWGRQQLPKENPGEITDEPSNRLCGNVHLAF